MTNNYNLAEKEKHLGIDAKYWVGFLPLMYTSEKEWLETWKAPKNREQAQITWDVHVGIFGTKLYEVLK